MITDSRSHILRNLQEAIKRIFDLICASCGLIILSPLFCLVALLIKLDSEGPIFFTQMRGGRGGIHFKIFKFRTMYADSETKGLGYKTHSKDSRITRVGRVLRKTSIDELPQLINVIKGEMSLIGPRPALTIQTDRYTDYQKQRLSMRPGMTGYAQVHGRNLISWDEKIEMDVFYVKNFSLWLDIRILLKTIKVLLDTTTVYDTTNV